LRDDDRGDEYDFSAACGGDAAGQLPDVVKRVMLWCGGGVVCGVGTGDGNLGGVGGVSGVRWVWGIFGNCMDVEDWGR
jgi:hypothetical protein